MKENKAKNHTAAQLANVIAFAAFILAGFLLILFLPKRTGEISPLEFRRLADYPLKGASGEAAARQIVNGSFSKSVDTFLEDHFPGRSFFIAVDSYGSRLIGRNAVQTVVRGKNGRLFDAPMAVDYARIDKNISCIDTFAADNGLDSTLVVVPTAVLAAEDELPGLHPVYHDAEAVAYYKAHTASRFIDVTELFKAAAESGAAESAGDYYYRTDHHWTMEGAYLCYCAVCESWGEEPVPRSAFTVEDYEFYGSAYRKAGLWLTKPDSLQVWRAPALEAASVAIGAGEAAVRHTGVYDEAQLAPGELDKYAAYVYSNNGLTVIENPEAEGEPVMIVKDSYGNSIAPLFAMTHRVVIMIDTRYYANLPDPSGLIEQYGVTRLVTVLGLDAAVSDISLAYLR